MSKKSAVIQAHDQERIHIYHNTAGDIVILVGERHEDHAEDNFVAIPRGAIQDVIDELLRLTQIGAEQATGA